MNGDKAGEEKLVYLIKVTDKITYSEYWENPLYEVKKPNLLSSMTIDKAGDNIYKPLKAESILITDFHKNHEEWEQDTDLSGKFILISNCFYSFGAESINIPDPIMPSIPKARSPHGSRTHETGKAKKFIEYIQNNFQHCIVKRPHNWSDEEILNHKLLKKCR